MAVSQRVVGGWPGRIFRRMALRIVEAGVAVSGGFSPSRIIGTRPGVVVCGCRDSGDELVVR